jgi:hypothetical protein
MPPLPACSPISTNRSTKVADVNIYQYTISTLDTIEPSWVLNSSHDPEPVFQVTSMVHHSGPEYILKHTPTKEVVRDGPQLLGEPKVLLDPQRPQLLDGVQVLLPGLELVQQALEILLVALQPLSHPGLIFLDKPDDGFPEILGYVFGVIGQQDAAGARPLAVRLLLVGSLLDFNLLVPAFEGVPTVRGRRGFYFEFRKMGEVLGSVEVLFDLDRPIVAHDGRGNEVCMVIG